MIQVSVIIPNYNHATFLKQRIDSVLAQTLKPFEIILLDDHSSDNSREIMEEYRGHPLVKHIQYNEINSGSPFMQWSTGIRIASAPWIWIAESDDIADENFLQAANAAISANDATGMFYCDSIILASEKTVVGYKTYAEAKNRFFETGKWSSPYMSEGKTEIDKTMKWLCTVNNSSASVFRKDLAEPVLNKLESFVYHGDWYCQLAIAGVSAVSYDPRPLNTFRLHKESFLRNVKPLQAKLECFRILDYLTQEDFVTGKEQLINFFTLQYLGFGIFTDGIRFGRNLFRSYGAINKPLARKVWTSLLKQKIYGKKPGKIF